MSTGKPPEPKEKEKWNTQHDEHLQWNEVAVLVTTEAERLSVSTPQHALYSSILGISGEGKDARHLVQTGAEGLAKLRRCFMSVSS